MNFLRNGIALSLLGCVALASAQQAASPHLGYAYPAGGKQGTTFNVLLGGQTLNGVRAVYVSGDGVTATVGDYTRPLTQKEFQDIRDKLQEAGKNIRGGAIAVRGIGARGADNPLIQKVAADAGITDKDLIRFIAFIRNRTDKKRQLNPQLAETLELKIAISPQAKPGMRELRLMSPFGLSNPIRFFVGTLPEYSEKEPNDDTSNEIGPNLPVILNGQIVPGDVDKFQFKAKKGAHLVLSVAARTIIPYLADAVPGWFQASMTLYDAKGKQVAFTDHGTFEQDSTIEFTVPADGAYTLELRDSIYRGREDFIYRVTIGELPYVTSIFPLGGPVGGSPKVAATGWNLSSKTITVPNKKEPGIVSVVDGEGKFASNPSVYELDNWPEVNYVKPTGKNAPKAMSLKLPTIVNGLIAKPGDVHQISFTGRAGDKFVAEVMARRLNSSLDSYLELYDPSGKLVGSNDDFEDKGAGMTTHQSDSYLSVTLPTHGVYRLVLRDTQNKGGAGYGYRLRVGPPRPDFALRIVPSSLTGRAGLNSTMTVFVLRKDGFSGDVDLSLKDAPEGFKLSGAHIPGGADKARFTLAMPSRPSEDPISLTLEGRALVGNKEIKHLAVPAEDMMQAFAYRHLVPVNDWLVGVIGRANRGMEFAVPDQSVKLVLGGTSEIRLSGPGRLVADQVDVELNDAPPGVKIKSVEGIVGALVITFEVDQKAAKEGTRGNLILDLYTKRTTGNTAKGKPAQTRKIYVGTLPALPFEIVGH